jgi:cell division septation protein DedD
MAFMRSEGRNRLPTYLLGLAVVAAALAIKTAAADAIQSNAAGARDHRHVRMHLAQYARHSGRVHDHTHAENFSSPAAEPVEVRTVAQSAEAQPTIIVLSAEPGAVVTWTETEPTRVELVNPKSSEAEPAARAHSGWLIQIGAFEGEDEARQHLREARLKTRTALAKADPYTERVQISDKTLYRARFAGFGKETAEAACKQLKRSHFECMALR